MPAHAHMIMLDFLDWLRLNFAWNEELTAHIIGSPERTDYEVTQDSEIYTAHLHSCGYHFSMASNMFLFLMIACSIAMVWLVCLAIDCIGGWSKEGSSKGAFMANFMLRFLYELVFEFCLCSILYMSYTSEASTQGFVYFVCVGCVIAMIASLIFCMSRGFKNGPYIQDFYNKGTLMGSFWSMRQINPRIDLSEFQKLS